MSNRIDPADPMRTKLISDFVNKREEVLSSRQAVPENQEALARIDKVLQILADQVEPN